MDPVDGGYIERGSRGLCANTGAEAARVNKRHHFLGREVAKVGAVGGTGDGRVVNGARTRDGIDHRIAGDVHSRDGVTDLYPSARDG